MDKFQSTFPQGERHINHIYMARYKYFNPRSHKGNDSLRPPPQHLTLDFNPRSHKGNDIDEIKKEQLEKDFNPRSHKGNDGVTSCWTVAIGRFQSTFPQGERHPIQLHRRRFLKISIHVPTRGTTDFPIFCQHISLDFNPRSHKGNDRVASILRYLTLNFNPRSHKGND